MRSLHIGGNPLAQTLMQSQRPSASLAIACIRVFGCYLICTNTLDNLRFSRVHAAGAIWHIRQYTTCCDFCYLTSFIPHISLNVFIHIYIRTYGFDWDLKLDSFGQNHVYEFLLRVCSFAWSSICSNLDSDHLHVVVKCTKTRPLCINSRIS